MKKARGFTLIDVLVIAGVVAILPGLIWPSLSRARENARRAQCLNNLKQLITAVKTYTPDYNEWYPTSAAPDQVISVSDHYKDLGILYPIYVVPLEVFTCPSTKDDLRKRRKHDQNDNKPFRGEEARQVSYAYGYNGEGGKNHPWTEAAPSETRVLADRHAIEELMKHSNHNLDGRNVAYADGHVGWISGKGKLLTNPDHPNTRVSTQSWWSERADRPRKKEEKKTQ